MGVGFYLTGRYPSAGTNALPTESWLDQVVAWFGDHSGEALEGCRRGQNHDDQTTAFASLHPAAEDLEIMVPEPGRVIAMAKSSTVGPGYHIHACELVRRLGHDLGIKWEPGNDDEGTGDETGYFRTGDRTAVENEMFRWLRSVACACSRSTASRSSASGGPPSAGPTSSWSTSSNTRT